jgi:predicted XRE-type DNA-binding protein
MDGFYLEKERKWDNFVQDSLGFLIQDNSEEKTFDMLVGDRIIRGIPDWVKYSGLKQIALVSV